MNVVHISAFHEHLFFYMTSSFSIFLTQNLSHFSSEYFSHVTMTARLL